MRDRLHFAFRRRRACGLVAAGLCGVALAACSGTRVFDGTPYAGDVQPTVPRVELADAEAAPLEPAALAPMDSSLSGELPPLPAPVEVVDIEPLVATPPPVVDEAAEQRAREARAAEQAELARIEAEQLEAARLAEEEARAAAQAEAQARAAAAFSFGRTGSTAAAPAAPETALTALPRPASPETFPNLADVPERPTDLPTTEERAEIRAELESDRAAADAPAGVAGLSFGSRATTPAAPAPAAGTGAAAIEPAVTEPAGLDTPAPRRAGTIRFAGGGTALGGGDAARLRQIAAEAGTGPIRIVGYGAPDSTAGDDGAAAAMARATAVASALAALGVNPSRVVVDGDIDETAGITDAEAARADIYVGE